MAMGKILRLEYENPKTHVKSSGKIEIKNQTPGNADLYFYGDICASSWDVWQYEDKCPQDVADFLNGLNGVQTVNLYINSGGGDSFAGLAIYNILKRNPAAKKVHIDGLAASAASIIAMAGDTIITPPGAQIMMHNPWTIAMGNANDFRQIADSLDVCAQGHVEVYLTNAVEGVTAEEIKAKMDAETWMTGAQAAEVFKNIQVEGEQIAASLDSAFLSRYKHVPKSLTPDPGQDPTPEDEEGAEDEDPPPEEVPDTGKENAMARAKATLAMSR